MDHGGAPAEDPSQARDHKREHGRRNGVAQTCVIERLHGRSLSFSLVIQLLDQGAELTAFFFREPTSFNQVR